MKISVLCTDLAHPVVPRLRQWLGEMNTLHHDVQLCFDKGDLTAGDILFLVSCSQIIGHFERRMFRASLVLHASDLPEGRGWSPHVWSVLKGADRIVVCLAEATNPVDTGAVWLKTEFRLEGHELLTEINDKLFSSELALMTQAVRDFGAIMPVLQTGEPGPYMRKRTPEDSRLDVERSIAAQFDLLRVVDNERFPAFFEHRGHRYILRIEKASK
jgi:methionyl-tRNA formyltransferase